MFAVSKTSINGTIRELGLGSNIGHGLCVGWVEHPDKFCWVSFLNPTYVPDIFLLSAKPNKMAEDRTVPASYLKKFLDPSGEI